MMPVRLRRVTGHEGRANDTLFQPAARAPPLSQHTLVFFGGDVQDYPEVMQAHRDNRNYVKWNLESMVRMLGNSFPTKHILVVRPSRIEYKSFSCYDNFVPSNNAGVPEHTPTHGALLHLERLLQGVSNRIKSFSTSELIEAFSPVTLPEDIDIEDLHNSAIHPAEASKSNGTKASASGSHEQDPELVSRDPPEHKPCSDTDPLWWRDKFSLDETQLTLVGFSKGCVVLNQLIYEFHYVKTLTPGDAHTMRDKFSLDETQLTLVGFSKGCVVLNQLIYEFHYVKTLTPGDAHTMRFMSRIADMYWLDGGHAGGKNTWITSRSLLETLTRLNVNVFVHVSPYQIQDESRPWIGREEKAFTGLLKKLGAKVNRYLHDQPGMAQSLHMHFEVLANFKTMQDCIPVAMPDTSDEEA